MIEHETRMIRGIYDDIHLESLKKFKYLFLSAYYDNVFVGIKEVLQIDPRKMPLRKLFQTAFLDRQGYTPYAPESTNKILNRFNLLISRQGSSENSKNPIGVVIKDWTRSIGVNSVIKAEHDAEEAGLDDIILVGNNFSLQARGMASRANIRLVSRGELVINFPPDLVSF